MSSARLFPFRSLFVRSLHSSLITHSIRAAGPVRPWNGPFGRTEPVRLRGEWMNGVKE